MKKETAPSSKIDGINLIPLDKEKKTARKESTRTIGILLNKVFSTRTLGNLIFVFSVIVVLISLSSIYLGKYFFILDLFSHFQLQYAVVLFITIITLLLLRQVEKVIPLGVYIGFLFFYIILPIQLIPETIEKPDIFYMNTNYFIGGQRDELINEIERINASTVVIVEPNENIVDSLTEIYGDPVAEINGSPKGCAIFTKRDIVDAYVIQDLTYPTCVAEFQDYTVYSVHPLPPLNRNSAKLQKEYFAEISDIIYENEKNNQSFIIVGDFNSTSYSSVFREHFGQFVEKNMYTWKYGSTLMIPIDHAFSNEDIRIVKGERYDSDHSGVYVRF